MDPQDHSRKAVGCSRKMGQCVLDSGGAMWDTPTNPHQAPLATTPHPARSPPPSPAGPEQMSPLPQRTHPTHCPSQGFQTRFQELPLGREEEASSPCLLLISATATVIYQGPHQNSPKKRTFRHTHTHPRVLCPAQSKQAQPRTLLLHISWLHSGP